MFGRYGAIKSALMNRKNVVCIFNDHDELERITPSVKALIEQWGFKIDQYNEERLKGLISVYFQIKNNFVILTTKQDYSPRHFEDMKEYTTISYYPINKSLNSTPGGAA